jgi:predicted metal-dependent hydrolase
MPPIRRPARSVTLQLAELTIQVERKAVQYARLRVVPPDGSVRLSLPLTMPLSEAQAFIQSRLDWIRSAQQRIRARQPAGEAQYLDGELHDFWGRRLPLQLTEHNGRPRASLLADRMLLQLPAEHSPALRAALLDHWYRVAVSRAVPALLDRWQPLMGVQIYAVRVLKMRSRWGSCTPVKRTMRLNSMLARYEPACLEYVTVHELAHLIEANHSPRFYAILDRHLPGWRKLRAVLNPPRSGDAGDTDEVD